MNRLLTFLMIAALSVAGCGKNDSPTPLDASLAGRWELRSIQDEHTQANLTKPATVTEDIEMVLSFTSSAKGEVSAILTTATTARGGFPLGAHQALAIPSLAFSTPAFDGFTGSWSWDQQFATALTLSSSYGIDSLGKLTIHCKNNQALSFRRK